MKLQGKVALITGAGSGIGRSIAVLFAAEGASIVACDVFADRLDALASELRSAGQTITTVTGDVSDKASAEGLVDTAVQTYGRLDVVVNNAGIMDEFIPLGDMDDVLWRRVLGVNLDGPMYISRKAIPQMIKQGSGAFVNIASTAAFTGGLAGGSAYHISKHGLLGLTRTVAFHYAPQGIRSNAICPGSIETNIEVRNPHPHSNDRRLAILASNLRTAKPVEIATIALFLASDDSSFINGEALTADAGWTSA